MHFQVSKNSEYRTFTCSTCTQILFPTALLLVPILSTLYFMRPCYCSPNIANNSNKFDSRAEMNGVLRNYFQRFSISRVFIDSNINSWIKHNCLKIEANKFAYSSVFFFQASSKITSDTVKHVMKYFCCVSLSYSFIHSFLPLASGEI